jgi:hypothetical protein
MSWQELFNLAHFAVVNTSYDVNRSSQREETCGSLTEDETVFHRVRESGFSSPVPRRLSVRTFLSAQVVQNTIITSRLIRTSFLNLSQPAF